MYWNYSDIAKDVKVVGVVFTVCSIDKSTDNGSDRDDYWDTETAIKMSDSATNTASEFSDLCVDFAMFIFFNEMLRII